MNPTITWLIVIVILCLLFPPLFGFVLGIAIYCGIWWFWKKVLG